MADVKISALPLATTPLAGTEVLPIVQSATTDQVSVANLTAGRAVSAASLTLTTTPLGVGSGGTGTSTAFTAGSVVFAGASGVYSQNNNELFWDNANSRLGVGTPTPLNKFHVIQSTASTTCSVIRGVSGAQLIVDFSGGGSNYYDANSHNFRNIAGTSTMTLDANGQLGVGTTSPPAGSKLTVSNGGAAGIELITNFPGGGTGTYIQNFNRSSGAYVDTAYYAASHTFRTNSSATAMTLDSSGNLLVGATSSNGRLTIKTAASATATGVSVVNSSGTSLFTIREDGVFYTGTAANSPYNLTTASAANVTVDSFGALLRSTSSHRYKTNIQDAVHGLSDILKLRSVTYNGINDGDKVFGGLIAEEVDAAGLTEFVVYDSEGQPDALHYGNMAGLFVKAIQELAAKVAELEAKI